MAETSLPSNPNGEKFCSSCGKEKEKCICLDKNLSFSIQIPKDLLQVGITHPECHEKYGCPKCGHEPTKCKCECCSTNNGDPSITKFKGMLPYATELFGVYQPLFGWVGQQSIRRALAEQSRNSKTIEQLIIHKAGRKNTLNITDPFISSLVDCQATKGSAVLSPVGLLDLYREYFFEFDSFLGSPTGHVWLSPGGTVELIEVQTRKQMVDRTIEQSTQVTRKNEESVTQQDDLSDAVKEDNQNNTKLGATTSAGTNLGVFHADGSLSFSSDSARHHSEEVTHKHSRTQSEKVSSEIRSNFKTTFRTVTETTDTSSRRYVVQNTTDKLVNYELRRKMRKIGVQLQHIGTRLCWQVYLDYPGHRLGLGELVYPVESRSDTSTLKPLDPKEVEFSVEFPLIPTAGPDNGGQALELHADNRQKHDYFTGSFDTITFYVPPGDDPTTSTDTDVLSTIIVSGQDENDLYVSEVIAKYFYALTPPGLGYTLEYVRITKTDPDSVWAFVVIDDPSIAKFHIQLVWANWWNKNSITFDLKAVWHPPSPDPYYVQLAESQKKDFADAVRKRLKVVSNIPPRPLEDLRAEERSVVYSEVIQQLLGGSDRHVSSELLRQIFDVDELLYFVAPDYWRPQPIPQSDPPTDDITGPKYPPIMTDPPDPTAPITLDGETVLSWYGYKDSNNNLDNQGDLYTEWRDNYLITEETQPAPMGSSLGWLIQIDGDERRNAFLNCAWVKAVLPIRPGHELEALCWLKDANVEGESNLDLPYQMQPNDPPDYAGCTIRQVLDKLAAQLKSLNDNFSNTLATETIFEKGFDPLDKGFRATNAPFQIFDQWIEVMPTDQVAAVEVTYDPKTGKQV